MITELNDPQEAAGLFEGWEETLIWSCLQGIMGKVYAPAQKSPASAMAMLGDFCFFAGKPDPGLAGYKPAGCEQDFMILTPQNAAWAELIEACYGERARRTERYAIKKEPGAFDPQRLRLAAESLPPEYRLAPIDERLFAQCRKEGWCRDWVSQYASYEEYREWGLGIVALKDGCPVAGASSYSSYRGGIEIEVDTREDFRRRGLAYACSARLILECLKRGLYPSWDAQNPGSVALAEKLGYHYDHTYTVYEIWGY